MSGTSRGFIPSADHPKSGPDYFTYYSHLVKELLSQDEDFLLFSTGNGNSSVEDTGKDMIEHSNDGSFLSTRVGGGLSDKKKERLNTLLQQTVADLSPEVDLMLDSVVRMCQLRSRLINKNLSPEHTGAMLDKVGHIPSKKLKCTSSSTGSSLHVNAVNSGCSREGSASECVNFRCLDGALPGKAIYTVVQKHCSSCNTKNALKWIVDPEGKSLCNACGIGGIDESGLLMDSITFEEKGNEEGEDDMQFLLKNDSLLVEETMKKYSDELFATLGHMEQQLEELLDTVVSSCRPMSTSEKQQLQNRIGKLAPKNLERIAAIVQRHKPSQMQYSDEILVDLLREDNVTVQRLYYYVEAVEKARKLSL